MLPPPDPGYELHNVRTGGPARDRQQGDGAAEVRPPAELRGHGRQHVIAIYNAVYTDVECPMVTLLLINRLSVLLSGVGVVSVPSIQH